MKHKFLILLIMTCFSCPAMAQELFSVLIPGNITCSDGSSVAHNQNLKVDLPDAVLSGNNYTYFDLRIVEAVTVKRVDGSTCDLPKDTVIERVNISLICDRGSKVSLIEGSGNEFTVDLGDKAKHCAGQSKILRRVSSDDLEYNAADKRYVADQDAQLIYNDTKTTYGEMTEDTRYNIEFVEGEYVSLVQKKDPSGSISNKH